ncbi:MAG: hypothetical protein WD036_11905 [Bauldia sp.]
MASHCPQCATPHDGWSTARPAGRMLRCRRCGSTWLASDGNDEDPYHRRQPLSVRAEPVDVSDAIVIEHVDAASFRQRPRGEREPQRASPANGRLMALGARLAVGVAIVVLAAPLVAALPRLATVAGLPDDADLLEFRSVRSETVNLGGVSTLFVEGEIVNRSGRDIALPAVRISLKSAEGVEVRSWLVEPAAQGLAAGRSIGFRSALLSPPSMATQVKLNLAARDGRTIGSR